MTFWVEGPVARPEPFKRPSVAIAWKAGGKTDTFKDDNPWYRPPFVVASFGPIHPSRRHYHIFNADVKDKDVLEMKFTMVDEDTHTELVYDDKLPVETHPCR